jgi:NAD(P)-dependent dehydrogenase (short-subunit alcohol dehydrogenase family)
MGTTTGKPLDGKTALVTGGSRGLGRAIAVRLGRDGASVAVHYNSNEAAAKETVTEIEQLGATAFAIGAELGIEGDADRLFATFDAEATRRDLEPALDILVNNAGIVVPGPIGATDRATFQRQFDVNVAGPFFVTQQAIDRLRDDGRIVNISSGLSQITRADFVVYSMSKGAIDVFSRSLAQQLGPRGITVNTVAPGVVDTDMNASWLRGNAEMQAYAAGMSVLGRVGEPEDIADVVAFLVSPDGRWVTGHWVDVTGGGLVTA